MGVPFNKFEFSIAEVIPSIGLQVPPFWCLGPYLLTIWLELGGNEIWYLLVSHLAHAPLARSPHQSPSRSLKHQNSAVFGVQRLRARWVCIRVGMSRETTRWVCIGLCCFFQGGFVGRVFSVSLSHGYFCVVCLSGLCVHWSPGLLSHRM